jgi:nucleoid-associated protein YgaU
MATSPQPFLASAPATKTERVSNTTLFRLAQKHYGDARYWTIIASANGLTDPWVFGAASIIIPNVTLPSSTPTGLLGM